MYRKKYNINPVAGRTRLSYKHTLETRALMSIMRKYNSYFLANTHSKGYNNKLITRMWGNNNHMFGKPVYGKQKLI